MAKVHEMVSNLIESFEKDPGCINPYARACGVLEAILTVAVDSDQTGMIEVMVNRVNDKYASKKSEV